MQTHLSASARLRDTAARRAMLPDGSGMLLGAQRLRCLRGSVGLSAQQRRRLTVQAKDGKKEPPDVPKPRDQPSGGKEWLQTILSRWVLGSGRQCLPA